jgi:hypothetical protein
VLGIGKYISTKQKEKSSFKAEDTLQVRTGKEESTSTSMGVLCHMEDQIKIILWKWQVCS